MIMPKPFSASQIKKFASCERAWAWHYLEGIISPQGPAAALGGRVHEILERWLGSGVAPDIKTKEGKIATKGIHLLPLPSKSLGVEHSFIFSLGPHKYRGFVDLRLSSADYGNSKQELLSVSADDIRIVLDHKTTGDLKWALSEEGLRNDVQGIIYAKESLDSFDVDSVMLRWVYYPTKGKGKARAVQVTVSREEVDAGMTIIRAYADKMADLRNRYANKKLSVLQVDYNAYACNDYGGCYYQDRCNLSSMERIKSIQRRTNDIMAMTLKERMAQRKAAKQGNTETKGEKGVPVNPPEQDVIPVDTTASEVPDGSVDGTRDPPKKKTRAGRPKGAKNRVVDSEQPGEGTTDFASMLSELLSAVSNHVATDRADKQGTQDLLAKSEDKKAFVSIYVEVLAMPGLDDPIGVATDVWEEYKKEFPAHESK